MSDGEEEVIGPMPGAPEEEAQRETKEEAVKKVSKKRKRDDTLPDFSAPHQPLYVAHLPSSASYERSYMHRDVVTFVAITHFDYIATASYDGHLKFWRKQEEGIEFLKHFRAHLGPITGLALVERTHRYLATIAADQYLKVFDVQQVDMINMISLDFMPKAVCWLWDSEAAQARVAVYFFISIILGRTEAKGWCRSQEESPAIHLFDGKGESSTPLETLSTIHRHPVKLMAYQPLNHSVVSIDEEGMMEYWSAEAPFGMPKKGVSWSYKSDTSLYDFKKQKQSPDCITFNHRYTHFATMGIKDRIVRVWDYSSGKVIRKYDESLQTAGEMQQAGTSHVALDNMEFGRRVANENDMERVMAKPISEAPPSVHVNCLWDESDHFLIYPTLIGIKGLSLSSYSKSWKSERWL